MFLIDTLNFYKVDLETNEIVTFEEQRCVGLYFSDNNYLYTLSHKRGDISSGFRLYDIENCINKGQDLSYLLSKVQVGCQGLIDFSHTNQRLVFLSSYDNIEVVPVLHRNTISFIGMSKREAYLATRVIDDKFIALSKKNQITTWGTLNGKVRMEWNLSNNESLAQDFSGYEIFRYSDSHLVYDREWSSKILLKSIEPVEGIDDSTFFDPNQTKAHMKSQVSYIKKTPKTFHEYKLIEIINEREVKEHLSFVFPFYNGTLQHMFFSQDM